MRPGHDGVYVKLGIGVAIGTVVLQMASTLVGPTDRGVAFGLLCGVSGVGIIELIALAVLHLKALDAEDRQ